MASDAALGVLRESISPRKMALKRYLSNRAAVVAAVVLTVIVLYVVLAPITTDLSISSHTIAGNSPDAPKGVVVWANSSSTRVRQTHRSLRLLMGSILKKT